MAIVLVLTDDRQLRLMRGGADPIPGEGCQYRQAPSMNRSSVLPSCHRAAAKTPSRPKMPSTSAWASRRETQMAGSVGFPSPMIRVTRPFGGIRHSDLDSHRSARRSTPLKALVASL